MNASAQHQQSGPFRGRFELKLDPKGRMALPPKYRGLFHSQNPELVVTNSRFRGHSCLDVYGLAEWEKLEKRISKMSSLRAEVQAFSRFYLSGGQPVEVDAQGRILVPQSLRKFAGLEADVVLVGLGSKFEIWSLGSWSSIYGELTDSFEETLNAVASLESEGGER